MTHSADIALIGKRVRIATERRREIDTYYGLLMAADAAFVLLSEVDYGWWGQAGYWSQGSAETMLIPTARVLHVVPHPDGKAS